MGKVTFVFEYEDGKEPAVNAGMEYLGGKVVAVAFRDALEEVEIDDTDGLEWMGQHTLQA